MVVGRRANAMKRIAGGLALAMGVGLAASSPASAAAPPSAGIFVTGEDLWTRCSGPSEAFCAGYVAAIADILGTGKLALRACLPGSATLPELVEVIRRYLAEHPDERAYTAYSVASYALLQRFPCPAKWLKQDPAG
jgi:Rap1a immunity proteins